jgi:two-component system response regulator (stage 0 sporulation protein A)
MTNTMTVLLTDEGNDFVQNCSQTLRNKGFEVQVIPKDGLEVLRQIENQQPDVLIMDTFLSHMDALGVMKELQTRALPQKPMIMLLSSVDNARFEQEALSCGADYYFLKPFDVRTLAERVTQLTGWKSMGFRANAIQRDHK